MRIAGLYNVIKCDQIGIYNSRTEYYIKQIGDDENGILVNEDLNVNGIKDNLIIDNSRPTTFKKRYVVENQKLFRVSRLESNAINSSIEIELIKKLELIAPKIDCLVISDFVYGIITKKLLEKIKEFSKKYNLKIC